MKISFNVQGMTCAACSARVEKATSAVPGVASVAVNLLKNSMEVQLAADANAAEVTAAIEAAVKKAGYGASPKGQVGAPAGPGVAAATGLGAAAGNPNATAEAEQKSMLHRLIASLVFTVPLFYISMGDMFGWCSTAACQVGFRVDPDCRRLPLQLSRSCRYRPPPRLPP